MDSYEYAGWLMSVSARATRLGRGHIAAALFGAIWLAATSGAPAQPISGEERIEPSDKQLAILQALTPEHFAQTASVRDDDLETMAEISTVAGYFDRGRFTDRVRSDNFLRAFIAKDSGRVRYQLYEAVTYSGTARQFHSVNYATPDGPVSADITEIAHDIVACYASLCTFRDTMGFDVPEPVLKAIAGQYMPGQSPFWRFRFMARSGLNWEDRMLPAEAAGLLRKVDAWRTQHGRP